MPVSFVFSVIPISLYIFTLISNAQILILQWYDIISNLLKTLLMFLMSWGLVQPKGLKHSSKTSLKPLRSFMNRKMKRVFYISIHRHFSRCQIFGFLFEILKNMAVYERYWGFFAFPVSKFSSVSNHGLLPYGHWQAPAVTFQASSYPLTHCVK